MNWMRELRKKVIKINYEDVKIIKHPYKAEILRKRAKGVLYKIICSYEEKLKEWAKESGIPEKWIHRSRNGMPHIDLWGAMARKLERRIEHGRTGDEGAD
ncbi:MAG: hypothetical protein AB1523_00180 [Bacillota bacterium]